MASCVRPPVAWHFRTLCARPLQHISCSTQRWHADVAPLLRQPRCFPHVATNSPVAARRQIAATQLFTHGASFQRYFSGSVESDNGNVSRALEEFRQRAGAELTALAKTSATNTMSNDCGASFRSLLDKVLPVPQEGDNEAQTIARSTVLSEIDAASVLSDALVDGRRERARLRAERADLLSVGFQTNTGENKEFASLIVCAMAGIFAVSVHIDFLVLFVFAYMLYRRSTKSVRLQHDAVDNLQIIVERLKEGDQAEAECLAKLLAHASAWEKGVEPPVTTIAVPSASSGDAAVGAQSAPAAAPAA